MKFILKFSLFSLLTLSLASYSFAGGGDKEEQALEKAIELAMGANSSGGGNRYESIFRASADAIIVHISTINPEMANDLREALVKVKIHFLTDEQWNRIIEEGGEVFHALTNPEHMFLHYSEWKSWFDKKEPITDLIAHELFRLCPDKYNDDRFAISRNVLKLDEYDNNNAKSGNDHEALSEDKHDSGNTMYDKSNEFYQNIVMLSEKISEVKREISDIRSDPTYESAEDNSDLKLKERKLLKHQGYLESSVRDCKEVIKERILSDERDRKSKEEEEEDREMKEWQKKRGGSGVTSSSDGSIATAVSVPFNLDSPTLPIQNNNNYDPSPSKCTARGYDTTYRMWIDVTEYGDYKSHACERALYSCEREYLTRCHIIG